VNGRAILLWQNRSMHGCTHVSLCQRRTVLLFLNPTLICFLNPISHARVATVIRQPFLYCMIRTRIRICQGEEKGYASTIPVDVPFSSAHGLVVCGPCSLSPPAFHWGRRAWQCLRSLHVQAKLEFLDTFYALKKLITDKNFVLGFNL